jgi:hypothetical protein
MSVIIQSQPEAYSLAYNDNPYVFFSSNFSPTQRFEVSVIPPTYPTDPVLSTVRVYPTRAVTNGGAIQTNKAYYDPSRILQTQIAPNVAIPSANHSTVFLCPNMYYEYRLFIREEIKNAQGVYEYADSKITNLKTVWNGVRNTVDWLNFDYTDYDQSAGIGKKFLTDAPRTQYIDSDQSAFLYFLQTQLDLLVGRFRFYDSTGTTLGTGNVDLTPLTNAYGYIACGTYDIENSDPTSWSGINPATILNGCSYYDITLRTSSSESEVFTFYINDRCSKYTPIRLHWLNRLGGFDSFNFNMKSMEETSITRASYKQEHHRFNGTNYLYDSMSRGTTDYHVMTQDKLTVNTPFLTEAESVWMNDFASSPVVYQEVNNELIAMSGKPKMIAKQTSLNDKLMQYTFELDYSLTNNRQRG